MIIAQSGFDANSKVITTDDQLLQTLDQHGSSVIQTDHK